MTTNIDMELLKKDAVDIFHQGFACSESVIYAIRKHFELDMSEEIPDTHRSSGKSAADTSASAKPPWESGTHGDGIVGHIQFKIFADHNRIIFPKKL